MSRPNETPDAGNVGGGLKSEGGVRFTPYSTTEKPQAQGCNAPDGSLPAYLKDGLIMVAGRHLASVCGHELRRTFDSRRELLRGALLFRQDVLQVARDAGVQVIVATERGTGKRWRVDLVTFFARGWAYNHPQFGPQVGLALTWWEECGASRSDKVAQLSLFDEVAR